MPLHPVLQQMCDAANQAAAASAEPAHPRPPTRSGSPWCGPAPRRSARSAPGAPEPLHSVDDHLVDGPHGPIPVRVYRPTDGVGAPLVCYFHGGGFVSGSVDAWDGVCRRIAKESGAVVVSVDYRLAPEHRVPRARSTTATPPSRGRSRTPTTLGADGDRVAVAGDSAGGNLAAAIALRARVEGPALQAQVLIYPVVSPDCSSPSMVENADRLPAHDRLDEVDVGVVPRSRRRPQRRLRRGRPRRRLHRPAARARDHRRVRPAARRGRALRVAARRLRRRRDRAPATTACSTASSVCASSSPSPTRPSPRSRHSSGSIWADHPARYRRRPMAKPRSAREDRRPRVRRVGASL